MHPDGKHVVTEDFAEIVVPDFPDVSGPPAETRDPTDGVRRRSSRHFDCASQCRIELHRSIRVDQGHRSLDEFLSADEGVVCVGDDIDEGIADSHHVVGGLA